MVIGIIHSGSGAGDQLFTYILTRVTALEKGYDFGFVGIENFKGFSFMNLDWGKPVGAKYHIEYPVGRLVIDEPHRLFVVDAPYYNPEVNFIEDDTFIDGTNAQDIRYFEKYLQGNHLLDEHSGEINDWLKVDPLDMPSDLCIIGFRGGEYATVPDLFLTKDYWHKAIRIIGDKYPSYIRKAGMLFQVHTDDVETARNMLSEFLPPATQYIHDIGLNWCSIRYAKHLIIANSAFFIMPSLLNENATEIIAPKYWAGRNVGEWRRPQNYYPKFQYI